MLRSTLAIAFVDPVGPVAAAAQYYPAIYGVGRPLVSAIIQTPASGHFATDNSARIVLANANGRLRGLLRVAARTTAMSLLLRHENRREDRLVALADATLGSGPSVMPRMRTDQLC
jgi:hypothetical protein